MPSLYSSGGGNAHPTKHSGEKVGGGESVLRKGEQTGLGMRGCEEASQAVLLSEWLVDQQHQCHVGAC